MSDPARDTERQRLDVAPCRLPGVSAPLQCEADLDWGSEEPITEDDHGNLRPWWPRGPSAAHAGPQERASRYLVNHEEVHS